MTDFVFIRIKQQFVPVQFEDIKYVLSSGHYVKIVTNKGIFLPYLRLADVEAKLPTDQFARINRQTIVALKKIKCFDLHTVTLDNQAFAFSDRYRQELEERGCVLAWKRTAKLKPYTVDPHLVKNSLS